MANKVGVDLEGKHRLAFDRALLRLIGKPTVQRKAKKRFVLAARRRQRARLDRAQQPDCLKSVASHSNAVKTGERSSKQNET